MTLLPNRMRWVWLASLLSAVGASPAIAQKQLLLDHRTIARVENAKLCLGTVEKDPANPLFQPNRPWENSLNNLYPNVLFDPRADCYKLWYPNRCA